MPDALATAIHAWRTDPTGASGRAKLERVFSLFRSSQLAVPVDAEGQLLVMQHTTRGAWLCVFTDQERFDEYRTATAAHWPTCAQHTGHDLAVLAAERTVPTGILVNPSPRHGSGADATLPLPPETVVHLVHDVT